MAQLSAGDVVSDRVLDDVDWADADLRDALFEDCLFGDTVAYAGLAVAFSRAERARFLRCDLSFAHFERSDLHGVASREGADRGRVLTMARVRTSS